MQCIVYIPHLIPPREADEGVWQEVNAPRLKTALARAAYASDANADADDDGDGDAEAAAATEAACADCACDVRSWALALLAATPDDGK